MVRQDAQRRKEDFEAERNQVSLVKISHSTALQRISNDLEALTAEEWDYLNRLIQDRKPT